MRELLTGRRPVTLPATATAVEAARLMADSEVGAVLVVAPDNALLGIFTERDLMKRVVVPGLDPAATRVGDHMTRELFSASPERRVDEMAREMDRRHIRHLPVIEGERVLGILSLRDLLREHLTLKETEVDALTAYIQGDPAEPPE